jgi:hypothetical protein
VDKRALRDRIREELAERGITEAPKLHNADTGGAG